MTQHLLLHSLCRRICLVCLMLFLTTNATAQWFTVQGRILENARGRTPMSFVTVEILNKDSVSLKKTTTGNDGRFYLQYWGDEKRIVRASLEGYETIYKDIKAEEDGEIIRLGDLLITPEYIGEKAYVTAQRQMLTIKADTLVFHTSAFHLPPGATLGALVAQIPGLEMDENGNLVFHGKQVGAILVDGHDFFTNPTTALQNVTAETVQDVKVYERTDLEADFKREEQVERSTVLDLTIKPEYRRSWNANLDASVGTHNRYQGKGFVTNFDDRSRIALYGQTNNISEGLISDGNGNWYNYSQGSGLFTYRSLGGTYSFDNGKGNRDKGYLEGNVKFDYNHNDGRTNNLTHREAYANDSLTHFDYTHARGYTHNRNFHIDGVLTYNTDSLNRFGIAISTQFGNTHSNSLTAQSVLTAPQVGDDPSNMLIDSNNANPDAVYARSDEGRRRKNSSTLTLEGGYTHRFRGHKKRNISFRTEMRHSSHSGRKNSAYHLLQFQLPQEQQRTELYRRQKDATQTNTLDFNSEYTDAIGSIFSYKLGYSFGIKRNHDDEWLAQADGMSILGNEIPIRISEMPLAKAFYKTYNNLYTVDEDNSYRERTTTILHGLRLTLKADWEKLHAEANVTQDFANEHLNYTRGGTTYTPHRTYNTLNWMGTLRWQPVKTFQTYLYYNGSTDVHSLVDMLPIINTTDPMNTLIGAPNLHKQINHRASLYVNYTHPESGASYGASLNGGLSDGVPTTISVINPLSGQSTTSRHSVNGNYSYNLSLSTTQPLDSARHWKLRLNARYGQNIRHAFVGSFGDEIGLTNVFGRTFGGGINLSWNTKLFQVNLSGQYTYENTQAGRASNLSEHGSIIDTKLSPQLTLSNGLRLSTSIAYWARTGFSDDMLNHGQWLWNATISQSFLKNKALSVELQAVDLLHQRTAEYFSLSGYQRTYQRNSTFLSYVLLHLSYRFSLN